MSSPEAILREAAERFDRIAIACSFQKEASVVLDFATRIAGDRTDLFDVFTLDTGVLFAETHETWAAFERHYGIAVDGVRGERPERLWETDPDGCCEARKVIPLRERLSGADAWVTGVRRDQAATRANTEEISWDEKYGLCKNGRRENYSGAPGTKTCADGDAFSANVPGRGKCLGVH